MQNMSMIKNRIKSVGDTRQITKAMYLIAISKIKKALARYEANFGYFEKVRLTLKHILLQTQNMEHPFLERRVEDRAVYIVIAGDKGLAGGYNHNVLNLAYQQIKDKKEKYIFTVGQIAREFFSRKGFMVDVEFLHIAQNPSLYNARLIANDIIDLYKTKMMDEVYVIYTHMSSSIKHEPKVIKLLPVEISDFDDVRMDDNLDSDILYEPSGTVVFDMLIPQYIIGLIYACLVQSYASEHSARMHAMDSATRNADKMIAGLKMQYNRARQSAITQEISEIIGGAEALNDLS